MSATRPLPKSSPRSLPRFAESAVQRARLRVVPQAVEDAPLAPFVIVVFLLLAGGVAGLLAFNTSMQQSSFTVTKMEDKADALTAKKQSLALDLEQLRDPQELAARAKRLGMVPPLTPAFVRLSDGTILGTPTPATPDDGMRINPLPAAKPDVLAPKPRVIKVKPPTGETVTPGQVQQ